MDTRKVAAELRLSQWSIVLRERVESGLSVRRWCAENAVNEKTYYYWQRKLREATCAKLANQADEQAVGIVPMGWVTCEQPLEADGAGETIAIEIGGMKVIATSSTDLGLLSKVCRALADQC